MSPLPRTDDDPLTRDFGLVRALARRIARDSHAADDLAQDAIVVALEGRRAAPRTAAPWWSSVLRNLGRMRDRGDIRRTRRELEAARSRVAPSTDELIERESERRELVGAVRALPAPYAETLRLRFLEGLSAREVAQQTAQRESTVATRTAKGLKLLRGRLAGKQRPTRRFGLAPLLFLFERPRAVLAGALTMTSSAKLLVAGGALALLLFSLKALDFDREALDLPARTSPPSTELAVVETHSPTVRTEERIDESAASVETNEPAAPFHHPPYESYSFDIRQLRGRVIDLAGQAVPHVKIVCYEHSTPRNRLRPRELPSAPTSNATGEFELEIRPPCVLRVESAAYATIYEANVHPRDFEELAVIVVAKQVEIAGTVVDEAGAPVAGAAIETLLKERVLEVPGSQLTESSLVVPFAETDPAGRFRLEPAPRLVGAEINVSAPGFVNRVLSYPETGNAGLHVVLERARPEATKIVGHVVLPDGSPATEAWVSNGRATAPTDADGRFVLDLQPLLEWKHVAADEAIELMAVQRGYSATHMTCDSIEAAEAAGGRPSLVLNLTGEPLGLRGRVVDSEGRPVPGVAVRLFDGVPFGLVPKPGTTWFQNKTLEAMNGGEPTRTNMAGEFELRGLAEREYQIEVMQRPSLLSTTSEPVMAGRDDVEIVLELGATRNIAGRVVDRHGRPVPGVRVSVSRKWPGSLEIGAGDTSDEDGAIHIEGATASPAFLRINGPVVTPDLFREIPEGANLDDLELVVSLRCLFQVDWSTWEGRGDKLFLLDENGEELEIVRVEGGSIGPRPALWRSQGLSSVHAISDAAVEAVLRQGDEEIHRVSIRPTPDEVLVLRF